MNEQTPSPDDPTVQTPAAEAPVADAPVAEPPAAAPSVAAPPPSRNTLIAGGAVIAVICGLVGYQLGDNNSETVSQRTAGPGRGFGNQQQMMPGQGQGFQQGGPHMGQQDGQGGWQGGQQDGQSQSGPPMSGAS